MRALVAAILFFGAAGAAAEEKREKAEAAKMENCPRLADYFKKRAATCPKTAAKAKGIECKTAADHDELNALMRPCANEIDARGVPLEPDPEVPPGEPDTTSCRAIDPADASVIAFARDRSSSKCKTAVKEQVIAKKCDGTVKKVVVKYQRRDKPAVSTTFRCAKKDG